MEPFKNLYNKNSLTLFGLEIKKHHASFNNKSFIKDWNKEVRIMLEEAGLFEENGFKYINGRQEEIILINSDK